jgi:hypothetical protein
MKEIVVGEFMCDKKKAAFFLKSPTEGGGIKNITGGGNIFVANKFRKGQIPHRKNLVGIPMDEICPPKCVLGEILPLPRMRWLITKERKVPVIGMEGKPNGGKSGEKIVT